MSVTLLLAAALLPTARPALPLAPATAPRPPVSAAPACSATSLRVDFARDPFEGTLTIDGPDSDRFVWDSRGGRLLVNVDSSRPTTRALAALPAPLTGADCFRLGAVLELQRVEASPDDFFQISFGLQSSVTTGANRTGTTPLFGDADTFDRVELAYFPNVTAFGGPTLSPNVFGGPAPAGDAFANFAAIFGPPADLGDNPPPLSASLPLGRRLQLELRHDPTSELAVVSIIDLDGVRPTVLETGLVPLDLSAVNATSTFEVDQLSIDSFFDAADFDPSTTSLVADVAFHEIWVEACCD